MPAIPSVLQRRRSAADPIRRIMATALPAGLAAIGLASCSSGRETSFESATPGARIRATTEAARTEDRSSIPHLIEGLESDDPAVRFLSIQALENLTGATYGYRYFEPEWDRRPAVDRWVEAYESGELDGGPAPGEGTGSQEPPESGRDQEW